MNVSPELRESLCAMPLSIVFADGEQIAAVRDGGEGLLTLSPPFHVSDEDVYFVLPDDIGLEIVDIFADGDLDLITEALRDGLIAIGTIERAGKGEVALHVEECARAAELLEALPYGESLAIDHADDGVAELNELDHAQVTIASKLIDARGLSDMMRLSSFVGTSWRVPKGADHLRGVQPTYVYSKRNGDGSIGIEAALFQEYEELVVLLRPALLDVSAMEAERDRGSVSRIGGADLVPLRIAAER
jgi:hypothetical protein